MRSAVSRLAESTQLRKGAAIAGGVLLGATFLPWAKVFIRTFSAWEAYGLIDQVILLVALGAIAVGLLPRKFQYLPQASAALAATSTLLGVVLATKLAAPTAAGFEREFLVRVGEGAWIGFLSVAAIAAASAADALVGLTRLTNGRKAPFRLTSSRAVVAALGIAVLGIAAVAVALPNEAENPYLPASDATVMELIRDENPRQDLSGDTWQIRQRDNLAGLPKSDLSGQQTDRDPSHWYEASYCDPADGTLYVWDANPYSQEIYQQGLSLGGC